MTHDVGVSLQTEQMHHALAGIGETGQVGSQFVIDTVPQFRALQATVANNLAKVADNVVDRSAQFRTVVFQHFIRLSERLFVALEQ